MLPDARARAGAADRPRARPSARLRSSPTRSSGAGPLVRGAHEARLRARLTPAGVGMGAVAEMLRPAAELGDATALEVMNAEARKRRWRPRGARERARDRAERLALPAPAVPSAITASLDT